MQLKAILMAGVLAATFSLVPTSGSHEGDRHVPRFPERIGPFERVGETRSKGAWSTNVYVDGGDTVGSVRVTYAKRDASRSLAEELDAVVRSYRHMILDPIRQPDVHERFEIDGEMHEAISSTFDFGEGPAEEIDRFQIRIIDNGDEAIGITTQLTPAHRMATVERQVFAAMKWKKVR